MPTKHASRYSIPLSFGLYVVFQKYWTGQGDPLYAVLSRRGRSVDWVDVEMSRTELERLHEVAWEIRDDPESPQDKRVADLFIRRYKQDKYEQRRVAMSTLHRRTIRLAASMEPGERGPLLAVLRWARRGEWKPLVSGDKVRVRWQDHPGNAMWIEELPRKGARRLDFVRIYPWEAFGRHVGIGGHAFLMENLIRDAKLSKSMSFDQAKKAIRKALEAAKKKITDENEYHDEKWFKKMGWDRGWWWSESDVYYLEVEPADYSDIVIGGKDWGGTFEWGEFRFSTHPKDEADAEAQEWMRQVEGMSASYSSKSKGGARKAFKLIKVHEAEVKGMTADQFKAWLGNNKIAYQYNPTVWR